MGMSQDLIKKEIQSNYSQKLLTPLWPTTLTLFNHKTLSSLSEPSWITLSANVAADFTLLGIITEPVD